jgi:glutamine synthetase
MKRENVRFVMLFFTDSLGALKCMEVTSGRIDAVLAGAILIDGSSIAGFTSVEASDVYLRPDTDSFRVLPFMGDDFGASACFMCDAVGPDGAAIAGCTRAALKGGLARLSDFGFARMDIGFEPEFFLFKPGEGEDPIDRASYCDTEGDTESRNVRREIAYELSRLNLECSALHHERAPGQSEVTVRFSDAISACDTLQLVKFLIKTVAERRGYRAEFMPKPMEGVNGSGLHTNISFADAAGRNVFAGAAAGELSPVAEHFVAGILNHAAALCFINNPTENSYKRFVEGCEAPVNVSWSLSDRSAMIRIPAATGNAARIEVRSPDLSCNPYLAATALLAAGLDGITVKAAAPKALARLPKTLSVARAAFMADEVLKGCLNAKLAEHILN